MAKQSNTDDNTNKTGADEITGASEGAAPASADGNDKAKAKKKEKVAALRVRAKAKSFRRVGLTFGEQPTDIALADLTKDQVAALKAEPMLVVEEVEIEK